VSASEVDEFHQGSADDSGNLRDDGVAKSLESVSVGSRSSSSRSVHPGGNPIIHSTNWGCRDPAAPRAERALIRVPPSRAFAGVISPPWSASVDVGVGSRPAAARPDNIRRFVPLRSRWYVEVLHVGVGSRPRFAKVSRLARSRPTRPAAPPLFVP